jgi:hypothetical protein
MLSNLLKANRLTPRGIQTWGKEERGIFSCIDVVVFSATVWRLERVGSARHINKLEFSPLRDLAKESIALLLDRSDPIVWFRWVSLDVICKKAPTPERIREWFIHEHKSALTVVPRSPTHYEWKPIQVLHAKRILVEHPPHPLQQVVDELRPACWLGKHEYA